KIEMLISLIRGYPHLYDKANRNFKDQHMKENSWKKIAEEVEMIAKDCQRPWTNLRNKYGREKKALPSSSGAPATPQWEYFDSMSFIKTYIKPRNTHTRTAEIAKTTTVNECAQPLQSPVFDSSCSSTAWSNSTMMESNVDSQIQGDDMQMSQYDHANEMQNEDMYEEIVIQMEEAEETEEQRHPVHAETVKFADKASHEGSLTHITINLPARGHSFLPADSVFGRVEKLLRKKPTLINKEEYLEEYKKVGTVKVLGTGL
uniref:Uncharacterized protein LOC114347537 n=1 Tax=Diabrotica virgifera virgifera TaxID=50390 RepID=A0A6P7H8K1_DIAVI